MRYVEGIVLYSFDGYEFKELWKPDWKFNPEYKITSNSFTVTSMRKDGDSMLSVRDVVLLTSGGPVVSTELEIQK